ncbi:MAG: uroporphyrinogen decarboxylase [Alphaproteobacteria bacterium]|nr:uroporphyrinogen decarboxylase [Alphaproteobacteria bacterium]
MTGPVTSKPLIEALKGETMEVPPVWLMRQAGRYLPEYRELRARARDFLDFCYTPELAVKATLQPVRRFAMDGAIIFSDILVVADALGQTVGFVDGKGPVLEPLDGAAGVGRLSLQGLPERLAPVYAAIAGVRGELPPATALIGFCGAPWTLATYMVEGGSSRDFARTKAWAYGEPEGFRVLIDLLVEALAAHLIAQVKAGAEVLQIFDSWAGVLPDTAFWEWSIKPIRAIVERVNASCPGVPVIGFPKGAGILYEPFARETGIDAVSIDTAVPCDWAARALQTTITVQGNLDPVMLVTGGTALEDATTAICARLHRGPFVFNLGHGVLPQTPPDNVQRLVDCIRGRVP